MNAMVGGPFAYPAVPMGIVATRWTMSGSSKIRIDDGCRLRSDGASAATNITSTTIDLATG